MLNPDKNGYLYAYIGKVEKEPNNNFVIFKSKHKIYLNPKDKYDLKWGISVKFAKSSQFDTDYENGIRLNGTTYDNCIGNYILLFAGSHINKTPAEEVKYMVEDNSVLYNSILLLYNYNNLINDWGDEWYDVENPDPNKQNRDTRALVKAIKSCQCYRDFQRNEIIFQCNEIIQRIQAQRNYDEDFIKNVLICIAQNFITVFAGQPGTGKTSLCDIISGVLGLYNPDPKLNLYRYRSVSVERGWNSKSELIGYYNALSNKFENSGNGIYDALLTLNAECNNVNIDPYPFFILLDEANLSPVEHYWSVFMKAADDDNLNQSKYRIEIPLQNSTSQQNGEESQNITSLKVPDQLRFLATINNDQTTEPLSPRLLDRTSVIKLPETANKPNPNAGYAPYYISWNRFKYLFSPVNDTEIDDGIVIVKKENDQSDGNNGNINKVSEIMNIIYGMFKAANISISKRVKNRIARYINSACFLDMPPEKAINYAVAQNLLPKINGFYEDFKISGENNTDSKHLFTELQGLLGNIKNAIKNNQQISLDKYKEDYLKENVAKQNATEEAFEAFKKAEANNDYISYLSL